MKITSKVIIKNKPTTEETERVASEILFKTQTEDRSPGCLVLYNDTIYAFEPSWYNIDKKLRIYPCMELQKEGKILKP